MMNNLGFAMPTTEDVLFFLFNLVSILLTITFIIKATIIKLNRKKLIKNGVNYLTSGYSTVVSLILFIIFFSGGSFEAFILNIPSLIIYILVGGVILLVAIFTLLQIFDFIFSLTSFKKNLLVIFVLLLGISLYPKKYTKRILEVNSNLDSPEKTEICRCIGIPLSKTCLGYHFKCEIKRHLYL